MSQKVNPFSIIRSSQDSVAVTNSIQDQSSSTKIEGDNPFDISHIPIRKNQYQEIQKLNITRNRGEENISLSSLPLWVIIISMILVAYLFFAKSDHLTILLRSMGNDNFLKMTHYESHGGLSTPYIVGYLIFFLNSSLLLFLVLARLFAIQQPYLFFLVLVGVLSFCLGKHMVNRFIGWVFRFSKDLRFYDFTIITTYNILALLFLIINVLIVFGDASWQKGLALAGATLFIIFLLSRYYKGLRIGQSYLNNYFIHFFLYFCAFEISPWVITYCAIRTLL